jgi:hypothetical protein
MKILGSCAALAVLCLAPPTRADEPAKSYEVPYRLTKTQHILVRAKINGKGPFNFIVDTGAPALFLATDAARQLGVKSDKGWGVLDRLDIEGGVKLKQVKARIETPFQVEGMNGLGLAGVELHGMMGYDILARFRMEIDFTRDKMVWTPLTFQPKAPWRMGERTGSGAGGLDLIGGILKSLGSLLGTRASPPVRLRGFLGVELADGTENPVVKSVLARGPAGRAGVQVGDRITHVQGRSVVDAGDVERFVRRLVPGDSLKLTVLRNKDSKDITLLIAEGL